MRTVYEAYLTKIDESYFSYLDKFYRSILFNTIEKYDIEELKEIYTVKGSRLNNDNYFLYLDEFHYSVVINSIGINNIQKIRILYKDTRGQLIDEVIYDGHGKVPEISDIIQLFYVKQCNEKIIINDRIEIAFVWWEDMTIIADYETIVRCINGQKEVVNTAQKEILNQLTDSQNTYFKLKNDLLIQSQTMNIESFMEMLENSYGPKYEELMLDESYTDEDRAEAKFFLDVFEYENIKLVETGEVIEINKLKQN